MENARLMSIPYLSPSASRYPVGRIYFYKSDTLTPVGGSNQVVSDSDVERILKAISNRTLIPSYMEKVQQSKFKRELTSLFDKLRISVGWALGERYVTPSPWRKISLEFRRKLHYKTWESFAHKNLPSHIDSNPWVLYPLQMQPEANIEVWGKPWSNQTELIRLAALALEREGAVLVVKPNPKSKYEITHDLCQLLKNTKNIIPLSHTTSMKEVFGKSKLIMTVTGTVLLEGIFSSKPVASLGNHTMSSYPGVQRLKEPEDIANVLRMS